MSRFYFQFRQGTHRITDDAGEEFPSVADATAHARLVAHDLARNASAQKIAGGSVVVLDESGNELAAVPLEEISAAEAGRQGLRQPSH